MANILIVDDSLVMRKNLKAILFEAGHTIAGEATNGKQAIAMYEEIHPDMVTMDISMPNLSGIEAVKGIIKFDPNAKIIMVSAVNQKHMVFKAIEAGAKHYVVKPIKADRLMSVVQEVLHLSESDETTNSVEPVEDTMQSFTIENINGCFVILFQPNFSLHDFQLLKTAIQGILFIKPLNVHFDFTKVNTLAEEILTLIIHLAKEVEASGGTIEFLASSTYMKEQLSL